MHAARQPGSLPGLASRLHYERHRPEQTTLYRLVQQHAASFIAHTEASTDAELPRFIKDEFDAFLECGILAHGFLRLRCGSDEASMTGETFDPDGAASPMHRHGGWPRMRLAARTLFALLLGGVAVLGSIFVFRQGLLPLIDAWFQPDAGTLSAIRRIGILLAAVAGYWGYVRWHEKSRAIELKPRLLGVPLGAASGALMVVLPMSLLFAIDAYEPLLFRGASSALWGVAALIVIAATLEELVYRCLLFRVLERSTGTGIALVVQALVFAVGHLENLPDASPGDAAREARLVRSAVGLGVVGYLLKPFTFADLRERLEAYQHYRARLDSPGLTTQRGVDAVFRDLRRPAVGAGLPPKGLAGEMLEQVIAVLREASPAGMSASDVARSLGTSRVTARRYLQYLADEGRVARSQRATGSGRPEVVFTWQE